jgi:hypothetical protein
LSIYYLQMSLKLLSWPKSFPHYSNLSPIMIIIVQNLANLKARAFSGQKCRISRAFWLKYNQNYRLSYQLKALYYGLSYKVSSLNRFILCFSKYEAKQVSLFRAINWPMREISLCYKTSNFEHAVFCIRNEAAYFAYLVWKHTFDGIKRISLVYLFRETSKIICFGWICVSRNKTEYETGNCFFILFSTYVMKHNRPQNCVYIF